MHILVIEDEPSIREFVRQGLEELDFQVTVCADGKLGYQLASQESYDLIILDLMLPVMDGMAILRQLRGEGHSTPVLILSARHSVDERVLGYSPVPMIIWSSHSRLPSWRLAVRLCSGVRARLQVRMSSVIRG